MSQPLTSSRQPGRVVPVTADMRPRRGLPRLPVGYVPPRTVERLIRGPLPAVVTLQAPRAFGKTAAVSWLLRNDEDQRHDHVWVSVPQRGVDAEGMWDTLQRRLRDIGLDDLDWPALNRSLARRRRRLVLVVDNLDRADIGVDEDLATLAGEHEQIDVVAMMRQPRPIQLYATQLDGVNLHSDDLRIGPLDTQRMARQVGQPLDEADAAELNRQLRGWPALMRIVLGERILHVNGELVVDQGLVDRFVRLMINEIPHPGTRRAVQVLAVPEILPHELVLALVGQESWDRMSAFLADLGLSPHEVSGRSPGPDPIRAAAARMLADDDIEAYRDVSGRSARWFRARGAVAPALRHALAAADWELVAAILREEWSMLLADHPALVRQAVDNLPKELADADARLVVARDYILNIATDDRAREAFVAQLLLPDASARSRSRRRLSLRQVLRLSSTGLYDVAQNLVENRDLSAAIAESGWSDEVVRTVPRLLQEWAVASLVDTPGLTSVYAFCEAAEWAEHLGDQAVLLDAAAGAALAHVAIGNPRGGQAWLDKLASLPDPEPGTFAAVTAGLTRGVMARQVSADVVGLDEDYDIPEELGDLQVLPVVLRADRLLKEDRAREGIRLLETYRVRPLDTTVPSLAEQFLISTLTEAYLATNQVERARKMLLEVDANGVHHRASWAMVSFQSGEYEQVLASEVSDDLVPRQTLKIALLRACAALRLQQRAAALDAFQTAVTTAAQTGMLRPFLLIPQADLRELAGDDGEVAEMLAGFDNHGGLLPEPQDGSRLSPRELQVLDVVSTGASFAAVASRLYVSPNTVKSQMRDIYRKLGVRGREAAVERARELGVLRRVPDLNGPGR